jgi:glutamate 5-kinase
MTKTTTSPIAEARRLIVKIGSSLLVDEAGGHIRRTWMDTLCDDVARLRARGQEVILCPRAPSASAAAIWG